MYFLPCLQLNFLGGNYFYIPVGGDSVVLCHCITHFTFYCTVVVFLVLKSIRPRHTLNLICFEHGFPGHHVDMAEEHGALLLALEHRFYGDSINPDGLKTENLADLSSQQA